MYKVSQSADPKLFQGTVGFSTINFDVEYRPYVSIFYQNAQYTCQSVRNRDICRKYVYKDNYSSLTHSVQPVSLNLTEIQFTNELDLGKVLWNWRYVQSNFYYFVITRNYDYAVQYSN